MLPLFVVILTYCFNLVNWRREIYWEFEEVSNVGQIYLVFDLVYVFYMEQMDGGKYGYLGYLILRLI